MEIVLQTWIDEILTDLETKYSSGYRKQYKQVAERYLRVIRQHGPYQAALFLCTEITGVQNVEKSPKLLLHDHLFKLLGYEQGWLASAINEERDPMKCLEQGSQMTLFLMRICDRL